MALNKTWQFIFNPTADRQFSKLDHKYQRCILTFFERVLESPNPKTTAIQMTGTMKSFWRYRIGNHRVICRFEDDEMIILAVKVGHRREVYD